MKMLTRAIEARFAKLGRQDKPDALVVCKFFDPCGSWTWYATSGEPILDQAGNQVDFEFFGLVDGMERELGYFCLSDLKSVKGPLSIGIERDLHWREKPLNEVQAKLEQGVHQ